MIHRKDKKWIVLILVMIFCMALVLTYESRFVMIASLLTATWTFMVVGVAQAQEGANYRLIYSIIKEGGYDKLRYDTIKLIRSVEEKIEENPNNFKALSFKKKLENQLSDINEAKKHIDEQE